MATGGAVVRIRDKTGAYVGVLPEYNSLQVGIEHNDAGAVVLDVPLTAVGAATLLAQDVALLEVVEGSTSVLWGVYDEDDDDPGDEAGPTRSLSISAPGTLSLLTWAVVYPEAGFNTPAYASFVNVTPGSALLSLLNRAKVRGTLDGTNGPLITPSFTATVDSAGTPWPLSLWLRWEAGKSLYDVAQDLVERGFIDVRMRGLTWDVYIKDTTLAVDRPDVIFRRSREVTSSPRRRARTDLRTALLVTGDGSLSTEVTDAVAVARYGRREGFAGQSGASTGAVLSTVGGYLLTQQKRYKEGFTTTYDRSAVGAPVPLTDYAAGDFARADWYRDANTNTNLPIRVRGLVLDYDADGGRTVEVTFNDLFLEADEVIDRRIKALTQGSSGIAVPPPTPVSADTVGPNAPSAVFVSSGAPTLTERGTSVVMATISWPAVTTNTDGTPFDDLGAYLVSWSVNGANYGPDALTQGTAAYATRLPPGGSITARVAAMDHNGHVSAYTYSAAIPLTVDTTAPQAPTAPTVAALIGGLRVTWDGLGVGATSMPLDFDHVQAFIATSPVFSTATPAGPPLVAAGSTVITGLSYVSPYYVWLVAYDRLGNPLTQGVAVPSAASPPTSAGQVLGPDLGGGVVGPNALLYKDFGNHVPDGSFEVAANRARLALAPGWGAPWSFVNAGASDGAWALRGAGGTAPGTSRTLTLVSGVETVGGAKVWATFKAKGTGGANGGVRLSVVARDSAGSGLTVLEEDVTLADGTWQTPSTPLFTLTMPAATSTYDVTITLLSSVTAGTWDIDAVQVRDVVQTAVIDQAAIGTAQIQDLAVGTAQVGELSATRLSAGTLTAVAISLGSGLLTTAALDGSGAPIRSGARLEEDASGVRLYGPTSTSPSTGKVVTLNSDGTATFAGDISGASGTFGGTVRAANIVAANFDNLLQDGGFEETPVWVGVVAAATMNPGWVYVADAGGGAFTLTLPAAATNGTKVVVRRWNSGGGNVTVARGGTALIDGATTKVISTQYDEVTFTADGTNWHATTLSGQSALQIGYWVWAASAGTTSLAKWSNVPTSARTGVGGAARLANNTGDSVRYAQYFPCSQGDVYSVSAFYLSGATTTAGTTGKVRIFWYDSSQTFLSSSGGSAVALGGGTGGSWFKSSVVASPPAGAAFLRVDLQVDAFAVGGVFIDDVVCRRVVSDEQVGSITGSTITGGTIQLTDDTAKPRLLMTSVGNYWAVLWCMPGTGVHGSPENAGKIYCYDAGTTNSVAGIEIMSGMGGSNQSVLTLNPNYMRFGTFGASGADTQIESPLGGNDLNLYARGTLNLDGSSVKTGGTTVTSSRKIKADIRTADFGPSAAAVLALLRPASFRRRRRWEEDEVEQRTSYGFIAEEVEEAFPGAAVRSDYDYNPAGERVEALPGLDPMALLSLLVAAGQETLRRVAALEQRLGA